MVTCILFRGKKRLRLPGAAAPPAAGADAGAADAAAPHGTEDSFERPGEEKNKQQFLETDFHKC